MTDPGTDDPRGRTQRPPPPPPSSPRSAPAAHPSGLSSEVRTWGLVTHLSAFAGAWLALAFLGPLVVWLVKREEHPFLDDQGKEALNFNLSMLLYGVVGAFVGVILSLVTLGLAVIPLALIGAALGLAWIVLIIIAAIRANDGDAYHYPLTIRFVT